MANHQVDGSPAGGASFNTKWRSGQVDSAGNANYSGPSVSNLEDIGSMRTRLTAINATSYSAAVLDTMTLNDMIYALRVHDDAAGLT